MDDTMQRLEKKILPRVVGNSVVSIVLLWGALTVATENATRDEILSFS